MRLIPGMKLQIEDWLERVVKTPESLADYCKDRNLSEQDFERVQLENMTWPVRMSDEGIFILFHRTPNYSCIDVFPEDAWTKGIDLIVNGNKTVSPNAPENQRVTYYGVPYRRVDRS